MEWLKRLFGKSDEEEAFEDELPGAEFEPPPPPAPEPPSATETAPVPPKRSAEEERAAALARPNTPITEHATFALGGTKAYASIARKVEMSSTISIVPDELRDGNYIVRAVQLGPIGRITSRHPVGIALNRGESVLHVSVNSFNSDVADAPTIRLRVVTGPEGETYSMPGPRTYSIPLVGEQLYQSAVRQLAEGDALVIVHEPDNPYDAMALAVRTTDDATVGYLTRDCFIRKLVHDEGKGCRATVERIEQDRRGEGFLHVTIAAEKCPGPVEQRRYRAA